ncbi:MAG TPA: ATP-binding protein [Anaeromyxobacteraceae bacterium]|nr:ATP-binding protein [Anaeromyxobacteraceae bacterium]
MNSVRTRSLRFQLGATFLLVGLVPAALFGAVALTTTLTELRKDVEARNQALVRGVAYGAERYLENHLRHLREVALSYSLHPELASDSSHLVQHFAADAALRALVILDGQDRVLQTVPIAPSLVGADFSSQTYVRDARQRGAPTWSPATVPATTGQPSVALVVPGPGRTVVGYLDLDEMVQLVQRLGDDGGAIAAVVTRDGAFIARRAAPLLRQPLGEDARRLVALAAAGREQTARVTLEGREWLGSAVAAPATGWVALVLVPTEAAFASADRLRLLLFATFAGAIALALGAGYLNAGRILKPVQALAAGARRVADGQPPAPPPSGILAIEELEELGRAFESMAAAVRARELELARSERQLMHSQKLEAIGRLAGGVAHDFNNMLTAIIGYANVLREDLPPGHGTREAVDGILGAAERAANLTRSLLAYGRKQLLARRPLDLRTSLGDTARLIGRVLGEDVRLVLELPPQPLLVLADAGQLDQVLMNLCTNARDAMPRGGVLTISADRVALDDAQARASGLTAGGDFARLQTRDTGVGMSRQLLERVFEPFFTTKPTGKGTGLGLAIVQGIILQHGGAVSIDSAEGKGTTVTILLPMLAPGDATLDRDDAPPAGVRGGTEVVLLAEDEPIFRHVVRRILERGGYTVVEAGDGREAVEAFAANRERIALCILDVVMPELNGKDALAEIRRIEPGVRALFTSGYADDVLGTPAPGPEEPEVLAKPVAPAELLKRVRQALDGR